MLDKEMYNVLLEAMALGDAGKAIENQEKRGQTSFVASEMLPIRCPRVELEALGFVFGKEVDALFIECQFPPGWTKRPTDHSMWSELVDPAGNVRGSIFYKAAFYDRDAFMHLSG